MILRSLRKPFSTAAVSATDSVPLQSAFYPKSSFTDREPPVSKGFKSWKSLGWFVLANGVPIGAAYWYLQSSITAREKEVADFGVLISGTAGEVAAEISMLCKSADVCLLSFGSETVSVSPTAPEDQAIHLIPELPLSSYKYDPLLDVLTARSCGDSLPLNSIHLGLPAAVVATLDKKVKLTYLNRMKNVLVTLEADWEQVENDRLVDLYWRSKWGRKDACKLVRLKPIKCVLRSTQGPENEIPPRTILRTSLGWK